MTTTLTLTLTLTLTQVMAIKERLRLITFDGDQTLYSDGGIDI